MLFFFSLLTGQNYNNTLKNYENYNMNNYRFYLKQVKKISKGFKVDYVLSMFVRPYYFLLLNLKQ